MRCRSVSVSSRSGVSASLKLLFALSCRESPQRQQFARSQARDKELLFELVIGAQDCALYAARNFHISSIRQMTPAFGRSNIPTVTTILCIGHDESHLCSLHPFGYRDFLTILSRMPLDTFNVSSKIINRPSTSILFIGKRQ